MTAFAAFAACLLTTRVRLVQVQLLATLAAAVGAFYIEYEDAPRGYRHLQSRDFQKLHGTCVVFIFIHFFLSL